MNNTIAPLRTTVAIARAASKSMGAGPGNCVDCNKVGIAILPVVSAVMPNELRTASEQLQGLDRWLSAPDLKEHWYFLRALPTGYLYVLKADKGGTAPAVGGWDAYLVDSEGLLRKVPTGEQPAQPSEVPPLSQVCKRNGDNIPAQVIAFDPQQHPKAWMAYSRYRWTPNVLTAYARNEEQSRDRRMLEVDITAAAAGQLGSGSAVPQGMTMGPQLAQAVADYAPAAVGQLLDKHLSQPLHNRAGQAAALAQKMAAISADTPTQTGVVIALPDIVGVTAEINMRRSRLAAESAATASLGDADRARRRVVADVIEGIRASAEANPGPWWDRNYGPQRFLKHIKQSEWQQARAESAQFKSMIARVDLISDDFVAVKESEHWKAQQRFDFDADDASSWRDHGAMVAGCVAGSGLTKIERERVWYPVIEAMVQPPDNWLDRALVALHPGALSYIRQDKQEDKGYDLVKGAAAISDELTNTGIAKLGELHSHLRVARAGNDSMAALIESSGALLYRLRLEKPEAHYKLMRKVAVALLVRDGQVAQPKVVRGPFEKIAQWIQEVAVGPARTSVAPIRLRTDITNYDAYQSVKGNFGDAGWRMSQAMEGAIVFDAPKTQGKNGEAVAWVITRLSDGAALDTKLLARLGLQNIDLTKPVPAGTGNPFLEASIKRLGSRADVLLGAGVLFFQTNAFMSALEDYRTKNGALDKAGGGVGMLTAVLSSNSVGLEIYVAVQALRGVDKARLVKPQVWAARLSFWAGMAEGVYLVGKGGIKAYEGDKDSGYWTVGSGVAVAAAGVASYGAGMAVGAGLSGSASIATVLGISMGLIGWGLLATAFVGAAIYFAWQAWATDDENLLPVEYWLDNGVFGQRRFVTGDVAAKSPFYDSGSKAVPVFANVGDELHALQRVTLVAQGSITGARDRGGYSVLSSYSVAIPQYGPGTRLEVSFFAIKGTSRRAGGAIICEDGRSQPVRNTISPRFTGMREGPTLKIDSESGVMRLEGRFATLQEEPIVERFVEWVAEKETNPDALYAERIEMHVSYQPDCNTLPRLVSSLKDIN